MDMDKIGEGANEIGGDKAVVGVAEEDGAAVELVAALIWNGGLARCCPRSSRLPLLLSAHGCCCRSSRGSRVFCIKAANSAQLCSG
jgi:hypothetical protein